MAIVLPKFSRRRTPTGLAAEAQPAVNVGLCREDGVYVGNEPLTVKWKVSRVALDQLQAIEVSVLWHTEGKGDEDLHVHHFQRLDEGQIRRAGLADEQSLSCRLPATPLSYHGRLISVRWCVRLRLFMPGREIVTEQPIHLVAANQRGNAANRIDGTQDQLRADETGRQDRSSRRKQIDTSGDLARTSK